MLQTTKNRQISNSKEANVTDKTICKVL